MNPKKYLTRLICNVLTETGNRYCTTSPKLCKNLGPNEAFDVLNKKAISIKRILSFEIINLPKGTTPFCITKMTGKEIDEINKKTLRAVEEINAKALILSEEYCGNLEDCKQLICNNPSDPYLELKCLKSGGDVKAQWRKCIQSKKEKALQMLKEEKVIAESDGDSLASQEIDSLCDLINEIDCSPVDNARSDEEALMYWPALLLPAPKINSP